MKELVLANVKSAKGAKCKICGKLLPQGTEAAALTTGYRCLECDKIARKEWAEWCELYDYLKDKYFISDLPTELIKGLREYKQLYTYRMIYLCFKSLEDSLTINYHRINFNNDLQRSRYLLASFSNNIDTMIRDARKSDISEIVVNNMNETLTLSTKEVKITLKEKIDYDFLD